MLYVRLHAAAMCALVSVQQIAKLAMCKHSLQEAAHPTMCRHRPFGQQVVVWCLLLLIAGQQAG